MQLNCFEDCSIKIGLGYRFLSSSLLLVRMHLLGLASADPLLLPLPEDTAAASVSTQPPLVSLVGWPRGPEHVENIHIWMLVLKQNLLNDKSNNTSKSKFEEVLNHLWCRRYCTAQHP